MATIQKLTTENSRKGIHYDMAFLMLFFSLVLGKIEQVVAKSRDQRA